MRKYILLVVFCSFLTGCAYFSERMDAARKCAADPECLADVKAKSAIAKTIGDASGYPAAGAVGGAVVAALMLFFARRKKDGQA